MRAKNKRSVIVLFGTASTSRAANPLAGAGSLKMEPSSIIECGGRGLWGVFGLSGKLKTVCEMDRKRCAAEVDFGDGREKTRRELQYSPIGREVGIGTAGGIIIIK